MSSLLRQCMVQAKRRLVVAQFVFAPHTTTDAFTVDHTRMIVRHRNKGAKKGQHLQTLGEMAHSKERQVAEERRKKKKDKKAAKKTKSQQHIEVVQDEQEENNDTHDYTLADELQVDENELPDPKNVKANMNEHVESFKKYLKGVRGGAPTADMFDDLPVHDAYGKGTGSVPLKAVAQVVIVSPTLATATCFDPSVSKAATVAIQTKLELNPSDDGTGVISIPIPRVSMESRAATIKLLHKRTEIYKNQIRTTRRKALDVVKRGVAGRLEGISKDDAFRVQTDIEKVCEQVNKSIVDLSAQKEKEVLAM